MRPVRLRWRCSIFGEALAGDVEMNCQSVAVSDQLDAANLVRSANDPFAQREADAEILQIRWRGQHHDVRQTVIMQGDRTFLRHVISRELDGADAARAAR